MSADDFARNRYPSRRRRFALDDVVSRSCNPVANRSADVTRAQPSPLVNNMTEVIVGWFADEHCTGSLGDLAVGGLIAPR
jgi:hypothetical protein